jgi:hypothetical protein
MTIPAVLFPRKLDSEALNIAYKSSMACYVELVHGGMPHDRAKRIAETLRKHVYTQLTVPDELPFHAEE